MSQDQNDTPPPQSPAPEIPPVPQVSFGTWLREQRQQRKVSLEEVAAVTKVHIHQLKSLEEDLRDQLPPAAFVRGFLTAYARHLGLDEDEVLNKYKSTSAELMNESNLIVPKIARAALSSTHPKVRMVTAPNFKKAPDPHKIENQSAPKISMRTAAIIAGTLMFSALLVTLVMIGKNKKAAKQAATTQQESTAAQSTTPQSTNTATTNAPATTTTPALAPAASATPAPTLPSPPAVYTLEVRALEDTWISVRIDENKSQGMALVKGHQKTFGAARRVALSLSNAGAIDLRFNGVPYESPGYRGDVKTLSLPEQLDTLKKRTAIPLPVKKAPPATPITGDGTTPTGTPNTPTAPND